MRTVDFIRTDTGEARQIQIRALKRKEIRELKDLGYGYMHCIPTIETAHEAVEKALDLVLTEDDLAFLDECDNQEAHRAWKELLKETYGDKDEEKNLSATTGGTPTERGSTTAGPAKDTTSGPPPA